MIKEADVYKCKIVKEDSVPYDAVSDSADANNVLRILGLAEAMEEYFMMLCLNCKGDIIGIHEVSHGEISRTLVHPRSIFARALLNNAASIIVAHNHPSGDPTPSPDDIDTTKRLVQAGNLMGVPILDHIIIAADDFTSFRAEGLI